MLLLITLISLVPFLVAWYYFKNPQLLGKRSNYGNLISPALPIPYDELLRSESTTGDADLDEIKGRWVLLQLTGKADCHAACRSSLLSTKQIRLLLNKDIARVRRLLLKPTGGPLLAGTGFEQEDDLLHGQLSESLMKILTTTVGHPPDDGTVILIDPFANIMMWYPPDFDPYGVLKDLKHLLRYSQIG